MSFVISMTFPYLIPSQAKYACTSIFSIALCYTADQDTDKHKTIEDQMQLRSKVRLMKQFQWGVAGYVIAKAAVIMVPALVWVEPGDAAFKTIYILQNSVRWLFLAALCWIFR